MSMTPAHPEGREPAPLGPMGDARPPAHRSAPRWSGRAPNHDGEPEVDDPRRDIRTGIIVVVLFFGLFMGWMTFARLDAAAYARGQIVVSGNRQTVQHRDGGTISALNVREGQEVRKGDILLELGASEAKAQERALASQVIGLQAQQARLRAEAAGAGAITWPAEFATLTGDDAADARAAMQIQEQQFRTRAASLSTQKSVLNQTGAQLSQAIEGYTRQIEANDRQQKLIGDELQGVRELNQKGYAPTTRVRALERTEAQIAGTRGQYAAEVARSREEIGAARLKSAELDKTRAESIAAEMRDVEFQLGDRLPRLQAARDLLARTQVRAPATGRVVGLSIFTVGGVVSPGQRLMDIVPDRAPLVIDAKVSPADADDLRAGQETEVRFSTLKARDINILKGHITRVSADSFTDEKSGMSYFTATVTVPQEEMDALKRAHPELQLGPGLPAEVLVPLRPRTGLQYMLEPLTDSLWRSFREH